MKEELKKELENELANNKEYQQLSNPIYKKQKLLAYAIRTIIAGLMFYFFWSVSWVKYLLIAYIPFNLFGLFLILFTDKIIERKIKKTYNKIDELESE